MQCFVTDSTRRFEEVRLRPRHSLQTPEMRLVKIYPDQHYQKIIGFGGALTESSAFVFAQMPPAQQERLLDLYFGEEGNRYSFSRLVIQSSDFSLGPRAYLDDPDDADLAGFSIEGDQRYELPFIKAVLRKNPDMEFLASPWSPPAWAKTNRMMRFGGRLRRDKYQIWARIIARYVAEYRKQGIVIRRLTVQNEPQARQTWESCLFNSHQELVFASKHLRSALDECGLDDVRILLWDHNKEGIFDRARACLPKPGKAGIDGFAFHWYSGDHLEALAATREYIGPDRELIFSEGCDSFSAGDPACELPHAEHYAREIVGDLNAGANGILDWNVLLNSSGGPNHVGNFCDAPIMYDAGQDHLNVRLPYYYLGHFSRFIVPGSTRVLASTFTRELMACAFARPDKSIVVILLNCTDGDISCNLRIEKPSILPNKVIPIVSWSHSIMTLVMD